MNIIIEMDLAGSKYHGMAFRCYQFAIEFIKRGHHVMIVAASYSHARQINPEVKENIQKELIDGVVYKWVKTPKYKGNGAGRVIHMLLYSIKLYLYAKQICNDFKPDVIVSAGVTPFEIFGCRKIAKTYGAKLLYEVGDLWPLTPIELGGYSPNHPFIRIMQFAENYAYKYSNAVVSLLPCAGSYMIEHGMSKEKFNYIPNGIIINEWNELRVLPKEMSHIINTFKKQGYMLVGYAGSLSLANSLDYAFNAISELINKKIAFIVVGKGPEYDNLKLIIKNNGCSNIVLLPAIRKDIVPAFLNEMDVLYVGFKKQPIYRFGISPNKIYDYMMSGKPIIQAIEAGNDIVKDANCGLSIPAEDVSALKDALIRMTEISDEEKKQMGINGKRYVIEHNSYDVLTEKYLSLFNKLLLS